MTEKKTVSRRDFLQTTGAATGVLATAGTFAHPAIGASIKGANERINFAILGAGGRATSAHVAHLTHMKSEGKLVDIIGVCDVWDGSKEVKDVRVKKDGQWVTVGRGLYPVAEFCGLKNDSPLVTKDYRKVLASKDVDAVVIGTPDHWHAKMAIDAMESGKDVYCEKPMCHTIDEAKRITETQARTKQIFTVGVQSTADPIWKMANDVITSGKIGHVMQVQTSYYRNSDVGQWRYYPPPRGDEPKYGRLEDVPRDRVRSRPRSALQPGQVRPVALLLGLRRRDVYRPVRPSAHPHADRDRRPGSPGEWSAAAASTWNTMVATSPMSRPSWPTTTRGARSSSPRRCATTPRFPR